MKKLPFRYISYNIHRFVSAYFRNIPLFLAICIIQIVLFENTILTLLIFILFIFFNFKFFRKYIGIPIIISILLVFSTLYISQSKSLLINNDINNFNKLERLDASVMFHPTTREYSKQVTLKIDKLNMYAKADIGKYLEVSQYDKLSFNGEIVHLANLSDYDLSLGIGYEIKNINNINIEKAKGILGVVQNIRDQIKSTINNLYTEPTNSLINGILLGSKTNLSEDNNELLKNTGIFHVISVSGSNFSIIFSFILIFSSIVNRRKLTILAIFLLAVYFVIVGVDVLPALRALIMILYKEALLFFGHMSDNLTSLAFSSAVILIIYPFYYLNISFQLSVFATLGIILISKKFNDLKIFIFKIQDNLKQSIGAIFTTSLITQLNFNQVNLNGLITNIFLLPLVPLLMLTSALSISLSPFKLEPLFVFISEIITKIFFETNIVFEKSIGLIFSGNFGILTIVIFTLLLLIIDLRIFYINEKTIRNHNSINSY